MQLIQLLQLSALASVGLAYPSVPTGEESDVLQARDPDTLSPELLKRGDGKSKNSPKDFEIDMSKYPGAFDVLEADCMFVLCFEAPDTLERGKPEDRKKQNTASGASLEPFKDEDALKKRKTTRRNKDDVSPEEYPYESTVDGGKNALLIGVTLDAQGDQSKYMSGGYSHNKIDPGDYFKVKYTHIPNNSVYCKALADGKKADDVCKNRPKDDMINFVYQKEAKRDGNKPITFKNMKYGTDKWTKP